MRFFDNDNGMAIALEKTAPNNWDGSWKTILENAWDCMGCWLQCQEMTMAGITIKSCTHEDSRRIKRLFLEQQQLLVSLNGEGCITETTVATHKDKTDAE